MPVASKNDQRLAKIFHSSHTHAWNGPEVIRQAVPGRHVLAEADREALAGFAASMLAVEREIWRCALRLAQELESPEACMAATAQAADEANHFVTIREYLATLGIEPRPVPLPLRELLDAIGRASSPAEIFLRAHLTVENAISVLFRSVARHSCDLVWCKVMPYFARDESRHVAFGEVLLPEMADDANEDQVNQLASIWVQSVDGLVRWLESDRPILEHLGVDIDEVLTEVLEIEESLEGRSDVLLKVVRRAKQLRRVSVA